MPALPEAVEAGAYSRIARLGAEVLAGASWVSGPGILVLVTIATDPPVMPPDLVRLVGLFVLLPGAAAQLIRRYSTVRFGLVDGLILLERSGLRVEIPGAAVGEIVPWSLPIPESGLSLRMRSGRRLRYALGTSDPAPLLAALADGSVATARDRSSHPTVIYGSARARFGRWRWIDYAIKFVLFPLLPAAVLFNAHQHIAYGGTLGQYYLYGPGAYIGTFAVYWGTTVLYLVLWARTWRLAAEIGALALAWLAPQWTGLVRRAVEIGCAAFYYAGVPVLLAVRFLT